MGHPIIGANYGGIQDVAVNAEGDAYVTGYLSTNLFDPNSGTQRASLQVVLAKYDTTGQLLWTSHPGERVAENGWPNLGRFVALDSEGDVYLSGAYKATNFYLGDFLITNSAAPIGGVWNNGFVARYSPEGNVRWVQSIAGLYQEDANGIAVDRAGNVYVLGQFSSFLLPVGEMILTNTYTGPVVKPFEQDLFLICYSGDGTVRWALQGTGLGDVSGVTVAANSKGEVAFSGSIASGHVQLGDFGVEHHPPLNNPFGSVGAFLARVAYPIRSLSVDFSDPSLTVHWPGIDEGYQLEWADPSTGVMTWFPYMDLPRNIGPTNVVVLEAQEGTRLFRLRRP